MGTEGTGVPAGGPAGMCRTRPFAAAASKNEIIKSRPPVLTLHLFLSQLFAISSYNNDNVAYFKVVIRPCCLVDAKSNNRIASTTVGA